MDDRGKYLAGIVVLILGVGLLALLVGRYDSRGGTLAREYRSPDEIRFTRSDSGDLAARIFTGSRSTVTEETTFVVEGQELNSAARAARNTLAARLGVGAGSVIVTSIESRDWPNSCLGLERPGQFCAQVIISGFRVTMMAQGTTYFYRTNLDGSSLGAEN